MATTMYFEEIVQDQGGEVTAEIEIGRSSFYAGCSVPAGIGEDSVYIRFDEKTILMDRATAKRFIEAAISVGRYHSLID
ncbi:hypothetical protein EBE87_05085 [Pseudoroseomonas wenyumeiae]|uniref:Uncharacterized protein n=1 Tax=Teichococcus wenyumeiae TaxID=2478470 RepID=A0A3A9JRD1_9PROT|nr:hypothetical protein [Pseudoroseomonas wenyumeiae]RKK03228.1 hypothetical protein D6Z83_15640 [Pseudoroseomonas wenyumeiae]RMI26640.1 hypothetical protein EBE87_05085 [Pseudoroseomonas wenyumeiae]